MTVRIWLLWNNGRNSFKIYVGFFKISDYHTSGRFKPSAKLMIRQIFPVGVILVDFLGCKLSRWGGWWGDCSFRIWSKETSPFFPLYCLKLAKDVFKYRLTMRCKGDESMCNLVLTSEAYHAVESCRRLSSFARLKHSIYHTNATCLP